MQKLFFKFIVTLLYLKDESNDAYRSFFNTSLSLEDNFQSPEGNFQSSEGNFQSSEDNFRSLGHNSRSPEGNYQALEVMLQVFSYNRTWFYVSKDGFTKLKPSKLS